MTDTPDPVTVGQTLTYTLSITNASPASATGVTVTDTLPGGVTFLSVWASQGSCSGTSTIMCNLGSLASGASATVTITVTPTASGTLTNTASASATEDATTANNNAATTTTVTTSTTLPFRLTVSLSGQG